MIVKIVGQNIKRLRKQAKLRQIDLSVSVGVDCSYLSSIENGKRNPTILLLENIATALNVPVEQLFIKSE